MASKPTQANALVLLQARTGLTGRCGYSPVNWVSDALCCTMDATWLVSHCWHGCSPVGLGLSAPKGLPHAVPDLPRWGGPQRSLLERWHAGAWTRLLLLLLLKHFKLHHIPGAGSRVCRCTRCRTLLSAPAP